MTMSRKAKALQFADEGYNIQITGRHVEVTDAMKNYAMEKAAKIEKFSDRIVDINIILEIQKLDRRAEIILKAGHTKIVGVGSSTDMYVSIDKAVDKIESQLRRYNKKLHDHLSKGQSLSDIEMNVNVIRAPTQAELDQEIIDLSEGKEFHEIVKQEKLPLKMLTMGECLMKMELSGDSFMIFKCEEDQKLKVIYRRKDENYGIIEPQC